MAESFFQQQYLRNQKKKKNFIRIMRILLFFIFLFLWEISARLGWIDSFIFCSPSRIG